MLIILLALQFYDIGHSQTSLGRIFRLIVEFVTLVLSYVVFCEYKGEKLLTEKLIFIHISIVFTTV